MKFYWKRFKDALTPGVAALEMLLIAVFAGALIGNSTHTVDLYRWLAPFPADLWRGQCWRLITHAVLPGCPLTFASNLVALFFLGSLLEQRWSRYELWLFCLAPALGTGLASGLVPPGHPLPLLGATPIVFGLLIAWDFVSAQETGIFPLFGQATVRQMVWLLAAAMLVITLVSGGLIALLLLAAGGLGGWLYLWLRQKRTLAHAGQTADAGRINRLEL